MRTKQAEAFGVELPKVQTASSRFLMTGSAIHGSSAHPCHSISMSWNPSSGQVIVKLGPSVGDRRWQVAPRCPSEWDMAFEGGGGVERPERYMDLHLARHSRDVGSSLRGRKVVTRPKKPARAHLFLCSVLGLVPGRDRVAKYCFVIGCRQRWG